MSWNGGPTYGMWADTVDQMDEVIALANRNNKTAQQWEAYAKKLEVTLREVADKYKHLAKDFTEVRDMYIDKAGALEGQARLKEAALKEIEKLDPSNKLLDQEYRRAIYDKEKEAVDKELRNK